MLSNLLSNSLYVYMIMEFAITQNSENSDFHEITHYSQYPQYPQAGIIHRVVHRLSTDLSTAGI